MWPRWSTIQLLCDCCVSGSPFISRPCHLAGLFRGHKESSVFRSPRDWFVCLPLMCCMVVLCGMPHHGLRLVIRGCVMGQINAELIEKAKAGDCELVALGALLNREISSCELTYHELVQRYSHLGLTDDLAKSSCREDDLLRRLHRAKEISRNGSCGGSN